MRPALSMALATLGVQASYTIITIFTIYLFGMQYNNNVRISNAANLSIGCWNCGGLSKIKKDRIEALDLDIACITETHSWRDDDQLTIYSELPPENDSWAGVALTVNKRLSRYIMNSGRVGSRIVFCRFRGSSFNIFVVGVYIPRQKRKNPCQDEIYDQLENFLLTINKRDCIILLGDFNSRLSRDIAGRVGHWCIHNRRDAGGDRLLDIMNMLDLRCVSTYYQPRKKHSNATYINKQPEKPPSQIDYIIVRSRWATSVRSCTTKWGIAIDSYGRKYDHGLVRMVFKPRLKCDRRSPRKDLQSLTSLENAKLHNEYIDRKFAEQARPSSTNDQWQRLNSIMSEAQACLPNMQKSNGKKWKTSEQTLNLVRLRAQKWHALNEEERKAASREISRSARNDYRSYVNDLLQDMEKYEAIGNSREVYKIAKALSNKKRGNAFVQPGVDVNGNAIISTEQQLNAWADFLEPKFSALPNQPDVDLTDTLDEPGMLAPSLEEVTMCIKKIKSGKASPDNTPRIEQFKASETATEELYHLIVSIFETEAIPNDFILGDMMMLYKKKKQDDRSNYRALGLLGHCYKVFSMVLLMRILPYVSPKLSDMQAGFRKERGCRDNILILIMTIQHLLQSAENDMQSQGVITYIDFSAAFDSISHSYLLNALKEYGVPRKICRLVKAVYDSAAVRVRLQERNGAKCYSRKVSINRGVIQGDGPSPVCFLVALDKALKDHGNLDIGLRVTDDLMLSDLEFADDAALPNENTTHASNKLTVLSQKTEEEAGMSISIPKTKNQHIMKRPSVSPTTETDIVNLPKELKFKFVCDKCGMDYPKQASLSIHQGRWCRKRKNAKKPSRKGTLADKIITRVKVEEFQKTLDKVRIGNDELDNVYSFVYLGAEIAGDGDMEITVTHRTNIAWGRFNDYRRTLTTNKLPVPMRTRLYRCLVASTMVYGSSAWILTNKMKQKINGVNSKMLATITKRTIHDEARTPTFNIVSYVLDRRWEYLGHILRLDDRRALKRFFVKLSPAVQPYPEGSLLAQSSFRSMDETMEAARDRKRWREENRWKVK